MQPRFSATNNTGQHRRTSNCSLPFVKQHVIKTNPAICAISNRTSRWWDLLCRGLLVSSVFFLGFSELCEFSFGTLGREPNIYSTIPPTAATNSITPAKRNTFQIGVSVNFDVSGKAAVELTTVCHDRVSEFIEAIVDFSSSSMP